MAPKKNMPVPSSPFDGSDNTRRLAASLDDPQVFPNAKWNRYCQIRTALRSKPQNDPGNQSPPIITTSPSGLPDGNYHSISPGSSPTSTPAGGNHTMTIESAVTTPFNPRLAYSSKEIQTTPSLAMTKRPSSVIEISSEDEEESFDGNPPNAKIDGQNSFLISDRPSRPSRVIIIDSDSSASDDDYSLKIPGAYPPSDHSTSPEPVTPTPIYVPRWLTSPTHMPTPAQRQRHHLVPRVVRVRTRCPSTPSRPAKNATSVDSDSEGEVIRPIRSLTKKNE